METRGTLSFVHGRLGRSRVVVEADDARQLPASIFELPELHEFRIADILGVVGMGEAMHADLDGSVAFERIHLQRSRNELALHLAADVVLDAVQQALFAHRQSSLIVVELQIVGHHRSHLRQIAMVIGIEERSVESRNGLIQRVRSW